MPKCWMAIYENCAGAKQNYFVCATVVGTEPFGCGVRWVVDGNRPFPNDSVKWTNWSEVPKADAQYVPTGHLVNGGIQGQCSSCEQQETPPSAKYDCINGACLPSTTYSTPGIYANLSECEINCGPGCSGVCISNQDWTQIEGLASQLKNKNCS